MIIRVNFNSKIVKYLQRFNSFTVGQVPRILQRSYSFDISKHSDRVWHTYWYSPVFSIFAKSLLQTNIPANKYTSSKCPMDVLYGLDIRLCPRISYEYPLEIHWLHTMTSNEYPFCITYRHLMKLDWIIMEKRWT